MQIEKKKTMKVNNEEKGDKQKTEDGRAARKHENNKNFLEMLSLAAGAINTWIYV